MASLTNLLGSSAAFRLLLVVSLWEGPVLWGHVHVIGAGGLLAHLQQFHLHEPEPFGLGWHWHLSLPEDDDPRAPLESGQQRAHPPRLLTKSLLSDLSRWFSASRDTTPATVVPPGMDAPRRCSAGGTCASRLTVCDSPQRLLCRLSC